MGDSNPSTPHEGLLLLYSPVLFGVVSFIHLRLTVVILWPVFCLAVSMCSISTFTSSLDSVCRVSVCLCAVSTHLFVCVTIQCVESPHVC